MTVRRTLAVSIPMLAALLLPFAVEGVASAQTTAAAKQDPKVEVMDFPDADTLKTNASGPGGITIAPGHQPVRTLFVRPRVSFVPEMCKSIEQL